jgi:phospholipid-binding lipoprotein MlaA
MPAQTNDRAGTEGSGDGAPTSARRGRFRTVVAAAAASLLALSGCATRPADPQALADYKTTNDPLEPTNRFFYRVNTTLDRYTLRPVAQAYVDVVPQPARRTVHRFLLNISSPTLFANDVLEGKPRRAGDTFMRFLINSTAGIGGLFDVAGDLGYPAHEADGGMTLATWGVPEGPFLFLPVLGPSSPRALTGFGMDIGLSPLNYVPRGYGLLTLNWSLYGIGIVDARAGYLNELDQVNRDALDPYATLRSLYRQHRTAQIDALRRDNRMTTPDWYTH